MERRHTLGEYLDLLSSLGLLAAPVPEGLDRSAPVELVSYDSREVVPGTLFLCKGAHFQDEFLAAAREKGALACVSQEPRPGAGMPCIRVANMRRTIAPLADLYYGHPSGALKVIGLTGTKGKSTTAYYLRTILDLYQADRGKGPTGAITSIETYDGKERFLSHMTTPEPLDLQRHLRHALDGGLEYVTMEVSSQALKYHRTLCTDFAAACFLNIGNDHISPIEHPDFEDYFTSKLKIFAQAAVNCVNLDCDHAERVRQAALEAGKPVITFSQRDERADVFASQVQKEGGELTFQVRTRRFARKFRLSMPGLFNVENALAAIAVCEALEIPERYVYAGLSQARVPGRMEVYSSADGMVTAIVDFAHNAMSFENLFASVKREYPDRKITAIFGCTGDKGLDRRAGMGAAAGRYAHQVVLTEDDSGEEDTLSICQETARYVEKEGCPWSIQLNRGEAIRQAILNCREPTVVVAAGKGTEDYQKRGTEYVPTPTDSEYVRGFLGEYDALHRQDGLAKMETLLSLLPGLQALREKTAVVRLDAGADTPAGEAALRDAAALRELGMRVVLVPGDAQAGSAYTEALKRLGAPAVCLPGRALGLTADGGEVSADVRAVDIMLDTGFLPVLRPSAAGPEGQTLDCEPDDAARAVAEGFLCEYLVFLAGLEGFSPADRGLERTDVRGAEELLDGGAVPGRMVPKVWNCAQAVWEGVGEAAILDGQAEHALLLHLLGQKTAGLAVTR